MIDRVADEAVAGVVAIGTGAHGWLRILGEIKGFFVWIFGEV